MIEGHFVVIEGIDGAGTTTQTALLEQAMARRSLPVHTTREPSDGPIGMLIRQVLRGRVVIPSSSGTHPLAWSTMALLFAADRVDHLEAEIMPNLLDGVTVISDRYDHSSVAYQSATAGDPGVIGWVRAINSRARRPDLTVVLDVSAPVAARRRRARKGILEIYEDAELQARLVDFYRCIERHFPDERILHVDANRSVEAVHADIVAAVEALRALG